MSSALLVWHFKYLLHINKRICSVTIRAVVYLSQKMIWPLCPSWWWLMPIELSPDWWQKFPENSMLQYLDLLGRGGRVKILLCLFLFSEIFCSLSSPGGTASHGEAAEQGARWSPSFAHPCGAFSHRSMIYSLWSSLDPHAPMLTPQKGLLCSIPSLCTAASSPSPAFGEE